MRRSRLLHLTALLLVFCLCLSFSSLLQKQMNRLKAKYELVDDTPLLNAPPVVAFTTLALGGFRGLLADLLFLRLQALQEQKRFFEIVQLGYWIVDLQPRMTAATCFLAWNMAYNISVTFNSHKDRWRWVRRGIELVRDTALRYDPDDPDLYHQLGWIYQHKVGQVLDDANRYYKGQMALQIIEVLGTADLYDWDKLAAAPDTEEQLKVVFGRRMLAQSLLAKPDAELAELHERLLGLARLYDTAGQLPAAALEAFEKQGIRADMASFLAGRYASLTDKAELDKALDQQLHRIGDHAEFYRILTRQNSTHVRLELEFRGEARFPPGYKEEFEKAGIFETLDFYFRSRWLRAVYKLDADFIVKLIEELGYLDFRLPEAHAVYWARQGLERDVKDTNLNRMVGQSMYKMAKSGRLRYISTDGQAVVAPNLESTDAAKEWFLKEIEMFPKKKTGFVSGLENFLKDVVVLHWMWGNREKAAEYLQFLRESEVFGKNRNPDYKLSLERFALKHAAEDIANKSDKQVMAMMFGLAWRYIEALALDQEGYAENILKKLKRIRQRYYEEIDKDSRQEGRKELPKISRYLREAKMMMLRDRRLPNAFKARIWAIGPALSEPTGDVLREGAKPKLQIQRD